MGQATLGQTAEVRFGPHDSSSHATAAILDKRGEIRLRTQHAMRVRLSAHHHDSRIDSTQPGIAMLRKHRCNSEENRPSSAAACGREVANPSQRHGDSERSRRAHARRPIAACRRPAKAAARLSSHVRMERCGVDHNGAYRLRSIFRGEMHYEMHYRQARRRHRAEDTAALV